MPAKVTGDSSLIHDFTYLLFCSASSNMTGYSHSYHSVKLIHYSATQRDVLSDKMVFWVVTHSFHSTLCQSSLLSTVISFVYKDKSQWPIFFYFKLCQSSLYKLCMQRQIPRGCTWNDFYTSCLSPFSLRKGLNIRVNLGPRISKRGVFFFNFSDISDKKGSFFLNNNENNSSDDLYQHYHKKKHIVWLFAIDFSKI